jgi:PAS domain S-box-containing protein
MTLFNHQYQNLNTLKEFITSHDLAKEPSVLVQMYSSNQTNQTVYDIRNQLLDLLPQCSLIATTTAGIISDGNMIDDTVVLSFSVFSDAKIHSFGFKNRSISDIVDTLHSCIDSDTKLILLFANTFTFDSTNVLKVLGEHFPAITLAGGNAGDDFNFKGCELFTESMDGCDLVLATVSSPHLQVKTQYLMNWISIGQKMKITKAEGAEVFEINAQRAIDVYRHYLGEEIASNLLTYGIQFPLIYTSGGVDIARALIAFDTESGSITFAGEIPEGCEVRFGFANIEHIEHTNQQWLAKTFSSEHEAAYVYSCGSRRQMLGSFLDKELSDINQIAPTTGFITYGEFFHDQHECHNNLLNITTTFVVLNEALSSKKVVFSSSNEPKEKKDVLLKGMTTLIAKTSDELEESVSYLEQFKKAVDESSIFSVSDHKGIITEANDNFVAISGYSKEELIGSPHSIVRADDMPSEVFQEMWSTIQEGKLWKGLVKNKRKDGRDYYVLTEIMPIYYKNGAFREYIAIRNDVTELEEYKHFLKNELDATSKNFEETLHYAAQYEKAINATTAILKTDTDNIIKYANEKFCEISGFKYEELINTNCEEMRHEKHRLAGVCKEIREKLATKQEVYETLTNIAKNGNEYVVYSLFYPVIDQEGNVIEHIQVMHDITEIVELNKEIVNTQKEVVITMGAIGETRSKETGFHVKRVAEYSYLLARLSGLDENEAYLLKQASPMHDIGKVAIPDDILNKPGKLTFEEFEIMKTHAQLGYEMLKHSERPILKASATIAHTHHEKYDGSGYPQGLRGEDIPIYGRITAIADVFDALGHDRVYKKAWEDERIFALFQEERGKHFDPTLIDLFFEHLSEFLEIRDRYLEKF